MESLRVGMIAYGLDRPLTGIGRYTVELARALERLDRPIFLKLLTTGLPKYIPETLHSERHPLCRSGRLPIVLIAGTQMIRHIVRDLDLQIIHDPTGQAPFAFGCGQTRTVITLHDVYAFLHPRGSTWVEHFITRIWIPAVLPRIDAVITISQNSKADIIRYLHVPDHKIHVIPEGVYKDFFTIKKQQAEHVLAQYGLEKGYTLTLSSLNPRRNLGRLLRAYALLREDRDLPLMVVIGKVKTEGIARLQLKNTDHWLRCLGNIPDADLAALYHGAGLFILPSLYEGFGLPPLEAMACGIPVACSGTSSLPEVVGEAALTFDPLDIQSIASTVGRLLNDAGLRDKLRELGFLRAEMFTWQRTAELTSAVYRSVLENVNGT